MSIAVIAEFNPFHNGHIFLLKSIKEKFPNEKIIIILSGKYTQRGEIAIASFEKRKEFALQYGANEVIELPFEFATQAAHIFAQGAIDIINKNKIDKIAFGSESNDLKKFFDIATTIKNNEKEYNEILKSFLKKGFGFPKASSLTINHFLGYEIDLPNDILGLEYIKAIVNNNYKIKAFSFKRTIDFHSNDPLEEFASASYLRSLIYENKDISKYSPMKFEKIPDKIENYYDIFKTNVISMTNIELSKIKLVSEGIENRFKKIILIAKDYNDFVNLANSKRYTSSRIKRIMLNIILKVYK